MFAGAPGVLNLARCNAYSSVLVWKKLQGGEVLSVDDKPVLCYVVCCAKASSILRPQSVGNNGYVVKDMTALVLAHEFPRAIAAICVSAKVDSVEVRCWGDGVKLQTRMRSAEVGSTSGISSGSNSGLSCSFSFLILLLILHYI